MRVSNLLSGVLVSVVPSESFNVLFCSTIVSSLIVEISSPSLVVWSKVNKGIFFITLEMWHSKVDFPYWLKLLKSYGTLVQYPEAFWLS